MSNIEEINIKRSKKKDKKILAVKEVIVSHHTKNLKKVQGYLLEDYDMPIPERTLKRYLGVIERKKKKEIAKKMKIAKEKQEKKEVEQITYPYYIKDPSGFKHKIMGDNHTITIGWGTQGLITYDRKDKIWRYDYDGKPFDKDKKSTPFYKTRNNLSWDY